MAKINTRNLLDFPYSLLYDVRLGKIYSKDGTIIQDLYITVRLLGKIFNFFEKVVKFGKRD